MIDDVKQVQVVSIPSKTQKILLSMSGKSRMCMTSSEDNNIIRLSSKHPFDIGFTTNGKQFETFQEQNGKMDVFPLIFTILVTILANTTLHSQGFTPKNSPHVVVTPRSSRTTGDAIERTIAMYTAAGDDSAGISNSTVMNSKAPQLTGPIHHTAIKTRNITLAIQFYSLLGFAPTVRFRTGPARAAWLSSPSSTARIELIEVPSFMLKEPEGTKARAVDLMQRQELLGLHHMAVDVTESMQQLSDCTTLKEWMEQLNQNSLKLFQKTLRVAIEPQQVMIGSAVYELAFIYDADGAILELLRKQNDLSQAVGDGWEPWDGKGFVGL
jgi:hypothetical protein